MTDLIAELAEVVRKIKDTDQPLEAWAASFNFLLVHHAKIEAMARDAGRWRFLCDECTHSYGDGCTEPNERSVNLEWQQGPWIRDGSNGGRGRPETFPGWSAIIDEAMDKQQREFAEYDDDAVDMHDSEREE